MAQGSCVIAVCVVAAARQRKGEDEENERKLRKKKEEEEMSKRWKNNIKMKLEKRVDEGRGKRRVTLTWALVKRGDVLP